MSGALYLARYNMFQGGACGYVVANVANIFTTGALMSVGVYGV